jgi:hypothetical protein
LDNISKPHKIQYRTALWFLFLFLNSLNIFSQTSSRTIIKGTVTDANTGEPVPYVSIILKGTTVGTLTDYSGKYTIETTVKASEILFSFLGYEPETRSIKTGVEQVINISLHLSSIKLSEVTIKPQREEYRNKGNPAVELIEKVISHKDSNRQESYNFLEYEKYEKIELAISNVSENFEKSSLFSKYSFIFNNIDTTKRIANDVLPIFLKETISDHYYRKEPEAEKDIILAEKNLDLQDYLDIKGVSANLNYIYQNINIYDNEILFLTNKFLSPVAGSAPTFYRYYITDTLQVKDIKCIKLFFEPRNRADFLFHGNLYITLDSAYAIREIDMGLNKYINIDWVKDISIKQDFENFGHNDWLLSREEISIDLGILKNSLGLYAQRSVSYGKYHINEPVNESVFSGPVTIEKIEPGSQQPGFWGSHRPIPLSKNERALYSLVDSVKSVPAFKRQMGIVMLLTTEFYDFGKFEMGPVGSFYSFNPVEGSRFRFGGRTTPAFSRKVTFDGYLAYGTADQTFKYNAGVTYSFTPRTIYEFPVRSATISFEKDLSVPGQQLQFTQRDNLFLSLNRGVNDKMLLNSTLRLEFFNEFENHFSFLAGYSYTNQQPEGTLRFDTGSDLTNASEINSIKISEFYLNLRYARNETFYQGKLYRDRFPNKYPVIQLNTAFGLKQIDNDYDYLRLQLNISRRYYISIIGYTDVTLEAGKIFGTVPYPLLFIHRANQSYAYQKDSYNLMNFLEFVSDRYASINIDHSFNGFILNKIPLMKRLKFREIVTFKMIYGNLADMNNPANNNKLFKFPMDENNLPLTYSLEQKPYIEAGVGLSNILRIFRIDLIKRFTYLSNPDVTDIGFRIQFRLDI